MTFRPNRGGGRSQFRVSLCAARGWVAAMIRECEHRRPGRPIRRSDLREALAQLIREMQEPRFDTSSRSARFSQKRDEVEAAAKQ